MARATIRAGSGSMAWRCASIPGTGGDWLTTLVFVGAAAVFLLPSAAALVVVVLAAAAPPVTARLVPGWEHESTLVFAVLPIAAAAAVAGDDHFKLTGAYNIPMGAAGILNIERSTLDRKIKRYNIQEPG